MTKKKCTKIVKMVYISLYYYMHILCIFDSFIQKLCESRKTFKVRIKYCHYLQVSFCLFGYD